MEQHAFGETLLEQARLEAVARTGRVTETELLDRLRGNLPILQLLPRPRADRRLELLLEIRRRDLVRLQQRLTQRRIAPAIVGSVGRFGNGHPDFLGQHPHGVLKPDLLVQLEELEDVAAGVATEAVEESLVRADLKRRRLLVVKRTQAFVNVPRFSERYVLLHDLQDVGLQPEVVDERLGK